MTEKKNDADLELEAIRAIYDSLKDLDSAAQRRVLSYVLSRLSLAPEDVVERTGSTFSTRELVQIADDIPQESAKTGEKAGDDELEGVSPVAQKWARRNDLSPAQLSKVFSLGVDEIELVAKSVPGSSKRERMHNVLLLTGAASYLGTGAPRVSYERLKETLGHYNAYDGTNFASYMKAFAPEATGTKEAGYTLTARGLATAAELVKQMGGGK